jgi:hypothetical protein
LSWRSYRTMVAWTHQEDQISNLERTTNHETESRLTPVILILLQMIHHLPCGMIGLLILKLNSLNNHWTHLFFWVQLHSTVFVNFNNISLNQ